eukprot:5410486-Amphidinium_carterae.1
MDIAKAGEVKHWLSGLSSKRIMWAHGVMESHPLHDAKDGTVCEAGFFTTNPLLQERGCDSSYPWFEGIPHDSVIHSCTRHWMAERGTMSNQFKDCMVK